MDKTLSGKKVAILVADGFEQVEMTKPREALIEAGAEVKIVSPSSGKIQGMNHADKGDKFDVDIELKDAQPEEFDALMIPGGLMNPDQLRSTNEALEFTRHFFETGKPVAAICHGPWVLIDAGVVRGRTVTSWPAIKTDLRNAGANLGGQGSRGRQWPRHVAQAGRYSCIQQEDDRGIWRRETCAGDGGICHGATRDLTE